MRENRVIVTGGAGFIGSYVVEELLTRKCDVLVIDNLSAGAAEHVPPGVRLAVEDLTARLSCARLEPVVAAFKPTHVIDMAASPYIPDSYASFDWSVATLLSNLEMAVSMAKLVLDTESKLKRYLYVSTSEVYGTAESEEPMREDHRLRPQSTYASSKLACERVLLNWHREHGLPVAVVRQFNAYGPRATHPYVIPEIIGQLASGAVTLRLGNICAQRDFTYVSDAAATLAEAALSPNISSGEVYNSGSGRCWSIKEIVDEVARVMGQEPPNIDCYEDRLRPHDVERLLCDAGKLAGTIGKRKLTLFSEGLAKMIDYYKRRGSWLWEGRRK